MTQNHSYKIFLIKHILKTIVLGLWFFVFFVFYVHADFSLNEDFTPRSDPHIANETDPFCDRHPDLFECQSHDVRHKNLQKKRTKMYSRPSAFDKVTIINNPQNKDKKWQTRTVISSRYLQDFKKHPEIYWAFESAGKGEDTYKIFKKLAKQDSAKKDIQYLLSRIGFSIGSFNMKIPHWGKIKSIKHKSLGDSLSHYYPNNKQFQHKRTEQIAYLYTMCEGEGFGGCDAFNDYFESQDIDSKDATKRLNEVQEYALKVKKDFPDSKNLDELRNIYPQEAVLALNMQDIKNKTEAEQMEILSKNIPKINSNLQDIKQFVEDATKDSAQDTKTSDPILNKLHTKQKEYTDEIEDIDKQLSLSNTLSLKKIKALTQTKNTYKKQVEQIKKDTKLYEFQNNMENTIAWINTVNTVFETTGVVSPDVIKLGKTVEQGFNIAKAAGTMLMAGALDPTGISLIFNAIGIIGDLWSTGPSYEEVVMEKLDALLKGQKEILDKLAKMDHKLDHIKKRLHYVASLISTNHREALANFKEIKNQLTNIQWDIKEGFADAKLTDVQKDHKEFMRKARVERRSVFQNQMSYQVMYQNDVMRSNTDIYQEDATVRKFTANMEKINNQKQLRKQLINLYEHFQELATIKADQEVDFATLSKRDIQKYLSDPVVENRVPFLNSMIKWLNNTKKREAHIFAKPIREKLAFAKFTYSNAEYRKLEDKLKKTFEIAFKKITFGSTISLSVKPQYLMHAQYQDDVFSEYISSTHILPINWLKQDISGSLVPVAKDPHISLMCQSLSTFEVASQTMRKNLQAVWNIYMFYFSRISEYINIKSLSSDIPSVRIKFKTNQSISQIVKNYKNFLRTYNISGSSYSSSFHNGHIFSRNLLDIVLNKYRNYKTSDMFLYFNNIVSQDFWNIVKDWKISMVRSYGYVKPKVGGFGGYVGDVNRFSKVQTQHWRWYLKHLYFSIIQRLNRHNLIVNWMRAYLAVDTMARMGFGEELVFHPKLAVLQKLMSKLKALPEPIAVPENFNPKKATHEYFTPSELHQVIKFFQYLETFEDQKSSLPMLVYANRVKEILALDSADGFVPKKYLPPCDTNEDRLAIAIVNAKKIIFFLKSFKNSVDSKDKSDAMYLLSRVQNWLAEMIDSGKTIDIKKELIQATKFQPVLNFINTPISYKNWDNPSCKEILQDLSKWNNAIKQHFAKRNTYHLFFPLPLPDESTWEGEHIGLGNVSLREQALTKASFYYTPSDVVNCPIKY